MARNIDVASLSRQERLKYDVGLKNIAIPCLCWKARNKTAWQKEEQKAWRKEERKEERKAYKVKKQRQRNDF